MKKIKDAARGLRHEMARDKTTAKYEKDSEKDFLLDSSYSLNRQNLQNLQSPKNPKNPKKRKKFGAALVSSREFALFCRQFAVMTKASVLIPACLVTLGEQPCSKALKNAIYKVYSDVLKGVDLADAFSRHPKVFPTYFVGMVRAGVAGGVLAEVLSDAALYYEHDQKHRKKLALAVTYPIFLLCFMAALFSIMVVFVVPVFEESFSQMGITDPPFVTLLIFEICRLIRQNALIIIAVLAALILIFYILWHTPKARYYIDMISIKLPFVGNILQSVIALRFARGMGILLKSGNEILDAFDIVAPLTCNKYAEKKIRRASRELESGESMYTALKNTKLFPKVLIQMLSVGEKSGNIDVSLLTVCDFLDSEIENKVERFLSLLQPVLFVIIGSFVALVFVAVYMPIVGIMGSM